MTFTAQDIFDLQVVLAKAAAEVSDPGKKKELLDQIEFYQLKKAQLITLNATARAALLAPRIACIEGIISELSNSALLLFPVSEFRQKAEVAKNSAQSETNAAVDIQPPPRGASVKEKFGLSPDILKSVQTTLKERGIYEGSVNGKLDTATKKAVRGFQRTSGLQVNGIPGPHTQMQLWPAPIGDRIGLPASGAPAIIQASGQWPNESGVPAFFGERGKHQVRLRTPFKMRLAWKRNQWLESFFCHEKVHDALGRIFQKTLDHYGPTQIENLGLNVFAGCFNNRLKKGGTTWSMHAWAIAVDIDSERNQLTWDHSKAEFAKPAYEPYWQIVESEGAVSLGRTKDFDWMHFQFARP